MKDKSYRVWLIFIFGLILGLTLFFGTALWIKDVNNHAMNNLMENIKEAEPKFQPPDIAEIEKYHIAGTTEFQWVVRAYWEFYSWEDAVRTLERIRRRR